MFAQYAEETPKGFLEEVYEALMYTGIFDFLSLEGAVRPALLLGILSSLCLKIGYVLVCEKYLDEALGPSVALLEY